MASLFAAMKQESQQGFEELQSALEKAEGGKKSYDDDRFYYPEIDKEGNASAIIRFLPTADGDRLPMMKFHSHSKQFAGGWYIEECPTTISGKCPMCEANEVLWNSGKAGQTEVSNNRKRKTRYVANILVIKDPVHPENEGKRFLFQFGYKIQGKITEAMAGVVDELEPDNTIAPCNIWNFWEGKNFSLRICKVEGKTNYDKSAFAAKPTPLHVLVDGKPTVMSDEDLETLWNSQYKLTADYEAKLEYKPYDDLKARLDKVTGMKSAPSADSMAKAGDSLEGAAPSASADIPAAGVASASPQDEDNFFDSL